MPVIAKMMADRVPEISDRPDGREVGVDGWVAGPKYLPERSKYWLDRMSYFIIVLVHCPGFRAF